MYTYSLTDTYFGYRLQSTLIIARMDRVFVLCCDTTLSCRIPHLYAVVEASAYASIAPFLHCGLAWCRLPPGGALGSPCGLPSDIILASSRAASIFCEFSALSRPLPGCLILKKLPFLPPADLSLYELHRKPHEMVADSSVVAVSPRALRSELMCPICLDLMKNTLTTKEVGSVVLQTLQCKVLILTYRLQSLQFCMHAKLKI